MSLNGNNDVSMIVNVESELEKLLANALITEGIEFEPQYRVYESSSDWIPLYTLDFMIRAGNKMINVECDGMAYHLSKHSKEQDAVRNAWLFTQGFAILRFDTIDIKYNINYCINTINRTISAHTEHKFLLKPENPYAAEYRKSPQSKSRKNAHDINSTLNKVSIFAASFALSYDKDIMGSVAFQLHDVTRDIYSDEYVTIYEKTNVKQCQALSVKLALCKLRKPCRLTIYTNSRWLADTCNERRLLNASSRLSDKEIFHEINKELSKHDYWFIFLGKIDGRTKNKHFNNLVSRAKQKIRQHKEQLEHEGDKTKFIEVDSNAKL